MKQEERSNPGMSSFIRKIGRTTYKVNVYFAENTTATFEDRLLHLMANDSAAFKPCRPDAE